MLVSNSRDKADNWITRQVGDMIEIPNKYNKQKPVSIGPLIT